MPVADSPNSRQHLNVTQPAADQQKQRFTLVKCELMASAQSDPTARPAARRNFGADLLRAEACFNQLDLLRVVAGVDTKGGLAFLEGDDGRAAPGGDAVDLEVDALWAYHGSAGAAAHFFENRATQSAHQPLAICCCLDDMVASGHFIFYF